MELGEENSNNSNSSDKNDFFNQKDVSFFNFDSNYQDLNFKNNQTPERIDEAKEEQIDTNIFFTMMIVKNQMMIQLKTKIY